MQFTYMLLYYLFLRPNQKVLNGLQINDIANYPEEKYLSKYLVIKHVFQGMYIAFVYIHAPGD